MKLKGSQTEINLLTAFAGESQARNRYTYFASKAKKEGFVQISDIFMETANQEKEHAERLFKFLREAKRVLPPHFRPASSDLPWKTSRQRRPGSIMNRRRCIPDLRTSRERKVSMCSPRYLNPLP